MQINVDMMCENVWPLSVKPRVFYLNIYITKCLYDIESNICVCIYMLYVLYR